MNLANNVKSLRLKVDGTNYTGAAGTTDLTSEAVDTAGFEGCRFIVGLGAITASAVTSVKVQQCDTSGGTYADLEGSSVTIADDDDNQIAIIDIFRPRERYLKFVTDRGTANAVVDFLLADLYSPRVGAVTQDTTTVVSTEVHVSPAEGTA